MLTKPVPRVVLGVVAAIVVALSAACSPPGSDTPTSETSDEAGSNAEGGGNIRYHLYQAPTSFSPFHSRNGADAEISSLHYRRLVRVEDMEFVPSLADSWEANEDATAYTFSLVETTWSDGEPFTADDVVYSFESYVDPATASHFSGQLGSIVGAAEFAAGEADTISGITAADDRTVTIELTEPNAAFLANLQLLSIVPEHVFGDVDRATFDGNEMFREPTVGIGPYIFSSWVTDDQIEFVPNPESFEPHPLDHVYAQYLTGDVARAQLETGEIDIAQLASSDIADVEAAGSITVQTRPGSGVMSLYTALDSGKLADPLVRQAILYAIDRQAIVDNVLAGNGVVPQTMLFAPDWAVPGDLVQYDYDPDKAKDLLAQAGWNTDTVVNLDIVPGQADRDAVMDIVAGQLQEVGIKAELRPLQPAELTALVEERGFDLLITPMSMVASEPGSVNERFLCDGGLNISAYCNEELDNLLTQAVGTTDQAEREALYADAQRILNAEQPALPLYVANTAWGSTERVGGFDPAVGTLPTAHQWTSVE